MQIVLKLTNGGVVLARVKFSYRSLAGAEKAMNEALLKLFKEAVMTVDRNQLKNLTLNGVAIERKTK